MSDKKRIEEIIEATLEEAKKKHKMKHGEHEVENEKEEDDEEEYSKKKMKKMEEARKYKEEHDEESDEEHEKHEKGEKEEKHKKKMKEEFEQVDEESSSAAESLRPNSRPKDEPKSVVMSHMMSMAGGMSKEDLNKFAATMAQFGPGKTYGVGDNSAHNQSTIDMKTGSGPKTKDPMPKLGAMKEDIDAMFIGEDLSEEFKEKATTLFEAAVNARVTLEVTKLQEELAEQVNEEIVALTEDLTEKLDAYLDYAVENWMAENQVAIESTLRNEIMEEFIDGLKGLFNEHYIEVPESKIDIVESLAEKVDSLETLLDETITENSEMKEILSDVAKKEIFEELSSDLALTQQEKFSTLAEGIEFDGNVDVYAKKLRIIKETYFNGESSVSSTNLEEETFEGETAEAKAVDPAVSRYVQALSRTVKK